MTGNVGEGKLSVVQPPAGRLTRVEGAAMKNADVLPPSSITIRAAFSPIMIDGALVLPEIWVGMIEASATRNPAMP